MGQFDRFSDNVRSIVRPFEKLKGIRNYADQFYVSEQDACKQLHNTTNLVTVLGTNKVAGQLLGYFEKEVVPASINAKKSIKAPFFTGTIG